MLSLVCYIRMNRLYLRWGWVASSWTPLLEYYPLHSDRVVILLPLVISDASLCKELQPLRCNYTLKTASFDKDPSFNAPFSFAGFIHFTSMMHLLMCTCSLKTTSQPTLQSKCTVTASCTSQTTQIPFTLILEQ